MMLVLLHITNIPIGGRKLPSIQKHYSAIRNEWNTLLKSTYR